MSTPIRLPYCRMLSAASAMMLTLCACDIDSGAPSTNNDGDQTVETPECVNDSNCYDGLFCNGDEQCINGQCREGTPPCPPFEDCELCDEFSDECALPCTSDDECFTGVPGFEQVCDGCFCVAPSDATTNEN